ncbi:hypothetical protein ACIA5G_24030 [Amycolatopsis sp. NPDC051758]|uniref:hypothetical protein n=1 Tax=Amycolatopsis sp. NPDC051758 TaxID=3363935 RepID=UPI0037975991
MITELLAEELSAERQRAFAGLLEGLAQLLITHAEDKEPKTPVTLGDRIAATGRDLLRAATQLEAGALESADLQEVSRLLRTTAEVLDLYGSKLLASPAAADLPEVPESPGP